MVVEVCMCGFEFGQLLLLMAFHMSRFSCDDQTTCSMCLQEAVFLKMFKQNAIF